MGILTCQATILSTSLAFNPISLWRATYFFFQTNKAAEQNRLWAGMAKETAHQIGTPLSSLMGWIALMKEQNVAPDSLQEMQKDIERLEVITERFSKVGSLPELMPQDIVSVCRETIGYLQKNRNTGGLGIKLSATRDYSSAQCLPIELDNRKLGQKWLRRHERNRIVRGIDTGAKI